MSTFRVDLAEGEVVEMNAGGEQDLSAVEEQAVADLVADYAEQGDLDEEQVKRIKAELRRIALKLEEVEHGSDEHRRLQRRYHELQERLGELAGGDADREKSFPQEDFSEQGPGAHRGAEWIERVAAQPDTELPDELREDLALQDELRRQAHEGFAPGDDLSDDEMYAEYRRITGEES